MPSNRQINRACQRAIDTARQEERKDQTPRSWVGYNENNLGVVKDASGAEAVGFVSGNQSVSEGDPVAYVGMLGQPGVVVTKTVPSIFEWAIAPENPEGGILSLINNYTTDLFNRVGIGPYREIASPPPFDGTNNFDDETIIYADSEKKWYGLAFTGLGGENEGFYFSERNVPVLQNSPEFLALSSTVGSYQNIVANHFVQGFSGSNENGSGDIPLNLSSHFFNLRTGELTSYPVTGTYNPISAGDSLEDGSSLSITGDVHIFEGLALDATMQATYRQAETEVEVDGPWPIPGGTYSYYFYRHSTSTGQPIVYTGGLPWTVGANRCVDDYFTVFRAAQNSQFGSRWLGSEPRPQEHGPVPNGYLFVSSLGTVASPVYSDVQGNNVIPGVTAYLSGAVQYRDGNLVNFTVIDNYPGIQKLKIDAVWPNPPVLPPQVWFGPFSGGFSDTTGFTLVYSDVEPCFDPRPYTQTTGQEIYTLTGNRYQPIARNEDRVLYLEARNIDYTFTDSTASALSAAGTQIADEVDEKEETWSADYACILQDLATGDKIEINAYQPITLPIPKIDKPEIGVAYSFTYANPINGWTYTKHAPALNNGNKVDSDAESKLRGGVSSAWKAWFSNITAAGDIPVFGITFGEMTDEDGSDSVRVFKGRLTALSYDDSATELDKNSDAPFGSQRLNNWPVEYFGFTIVFDEFLAEVRDSNYIEGVYFMGFVDLEVINTGSTGSAFANYPGLAIIDTGSALNMGPYAASDTAYDLANLDSAGSVKQAIRGLSQPVLDGGDLYQNNNGALSFGSFKATWRTNKEEEDELWIHYRDFSSDSAFSFIDYQLEDLIFPERPDPQLLYTLHAVFKIITNEDNGQTGIYFDRLDFIPNDVDPADIEEGNFYSFPDVTVLPGDKPGQFDSRGDDAP